MTLWLKEFFAIRNMSPVIFSSSCCCRVNYNNAEFYRGFVCSMHYCKFTYWVSKYGEGCDWGDNDDGGAQTMWTGGIIIGCELLEGKTCWDKSRVETAQVVVGGWTGIAVTVVLLVGVGHWFFELALLGLLSTVRREDVLPGTEINTLKVLCKTKRSDPF